ncbi:hypothetical protein [Streptomyces spongiae]|uniref:Uncharacterized protein n=1 Tax=Streptomyces spongiae TaxID=565072 RepID=A0A5N8XHZ0_9ACTN|nr:hypothetical protein [Streptomyces spongiae]MPY59103.1 hypothetical protein [Streptomyces spongiae]
MAAVSLHYGENALRRSQEGTGAAKPHDLVTSWTEDTTNPAEYALPKPLDLSAAEVAKIPVPGTSEYPTFVGLGNGARLWSTRHQVAVRARDAVVMVTGITAKVTARTAPLNGTLFWPYPSDEYRSQTLRSAPLGSAHPASDSSSGSRENSPSTTFVPVGEVTPLYLGVDLDSGSPAVKEFDTEDYRLKGRPYFAERPLTVKPGEFSWLVLIATATKAHYRLRWVLEYVAQGEKRRIEANSFAVTPGAGRGANQSRPVFSAYKRLFVMDYNSKKPRWRSQDPLRYEGG